MKRYEVEIESRISVKIDANSKEEASMVAMENSEFGERLLENAIVSDVEEFANLESDGVLHEKEIPEEAVKGLISAMEDVKKGDYTVVTNDDALHENTGVKE